MGLVEGPAITRVAMDGEGEGKGLGAGVGLTDRGCGSDTGGSDV